MKVRLLCSMLVLVLFSCVDDKDLNSVDENSTRVDYKNMPELASYTEKGIVEEHVVDGKTILLTRIENRLIFEGDIVVANLEKSPLARGASLTVKNKLWPNNIVYYEIASTFNDTDRGKIMEAIQLWQDNSNVLFFPRNGQTNYVVFVGKGGYSSEIGMVGGWQEIYLPSKDCIMGKVAHEIGHVLGLHHEHTRRDRDKYVTINWDNIEGGREHNFEIYSSGYDVGAFDFNSIMMYGSDAFTYNYKPTIEKKDGSTFIGQREYLSPGDIDAVARRYPYIPMYGNSRWVSVPADYDGDGKTDLAVKTNDGYWLIDYAKNGYGKWDWIGASYGNENSIPVPADYDGDGKADLAIKNNISEWYIDYAANGFGGWDWQGSGYGNENSIPVPADYDGDGKADLAIKNNVSEWYIDYAANGFGIWDWQGSGYGNQTCIPVPADYDGDGKADLSIKSYAGYWYIDYAANGFGIWDWTGTYRGNETAHPVPADYDGDGKVDLAVKTDAGYWYIDYSMNGFNTGWDLVLNYGGDATVHPVPADYDGDGKADIAIKADAGYWSIDYARNGFKTWDWSH